MAFVLLRRTSASEVAIVRIVDMFLDAFEGREDGKATLRLIEALAPSAFGIDMFGADRVIAAIRGRLDSPGILGLA